MDPNFRIKEITETDIAWKPKGSQSGIIPINRAIQTDTIAVLENMTKDLDTSRTYTKIQNIDTQPFKKEGITHDQQENMKTGTTRKIKPRKNFQ